WLAHQRSARGAFGITPIAVPSVDEVQGEVEPGHASSVDVDEEPRLEEVTAGCWKRTRAAADLDPAAARLLPKGEVPHEAVPEVEAWIAHRPVTRPERDPAPDAEAALRPVVRSRETNRADPATVERDG